MASSDKPTGATGDDAWASLNESDDWHLDEKGGARRGSSKVPQKSASGFALLVVAGPEIGRSYVLPKAPVLLGRGKTNDIVLSDGSISREHARLEPRSDGLFVVDLGSGNGTFIDGNRVAQATLRVGQAVAFGHVRLQLQAAGQAADKPAGATRTQPAAARAATSTGQMAAKAGKTGTGRVQPPARHSATTSRAPTAPGTAARKGPTSRAKRLWRGGVRRLQVVRAYAAALLSDLGPRARLVLLAAALVAYGALFLRHHAARGRAFAAVQLGAVAFAEHRWDEAEQAFVTANNEVSGYGLALRWQRALVVARRDEEALGTAKDALEKGDLLRVHALLLPLCQSPLNERVFALEKEWRDAQHGRILAAEAALQAHLPHEAQAMLEQIEQARAPRADRTSLLTWQRRLSELGPLAAQAAIWASKPRKAESLWEQAASQSQAMRRALRAFKRLGAADAPAAARKALGTPQTNDERKLLSDLNEFEQLWDSGIEEHRGKRAFAAIKQFSQAKNVSARLVGYAATLRRDLDSKLADMYYVVGMQTLAAGKLPEAAEALRAALALAPAHALSLRRMQELQQRSQRMVDEAEFVRVSRPARSKELLRQVMAAWPAASAMGQRARKLNASLSGGR